MDVELVIGPSIEGIAEAAMPIDLKSVGSRKTIAASL